ncbi:hypothetical protein ADK41_13715 [Streptomyces caelestis]|uniref:Protein kinase domain-containing protein n=1 Tax=Streptomyces caelestis TaxID=36816 RepID=A0A0M8QKB5_9ACTN|nr:hypothetical protein ADK41_13715 [Streptomyces caelestis]
MSRTHGQITPLNPEDPPSVGDFEFLGRIGQGGMGQVFLGESLGGEPAAAKVIKPPVVDSESRQRFAQEIEVLKTIWGPRIAAFLGADAEAEQPWPATEYVDGPDLAKYVRTHGPLPSVLTAALGGLGVVESQKTGGLPDGRLVGALDLQERGEGGPGVEVEGDLSQAPFLAVVLLVADLGEADPAEDVGHGVEVGDFGLDLLGAVDRLRDRRRAAAPRTRGNGSGFNRTAVRSTAPAGAVGRAARATHRRSAPRTGWPRVAADEAAGPSSPGPAASRRGSAQWRSLSCLRAQEKPRLARPCRPSQLKTAATASES